LPITPTKIAKDNENEMKEKTDVTSEHSTDGATSTHPIKLDTAQFIDLERMKG